jgi:hypothetical protein
MDEKNNKIAYICNGYAKCSMEPGCFMREDPLCKSDWCCHHTLDPKFAATPLCDNPEDYPERFVHYPDGENIKYYELMDGETV